MTDDTKRPLANRSNKLLEALRHLRDTEKRKREQPISSPGFHELADEVDRTSRRIFSLGREQERLGNESPRGLESINDVDEASRATREQGRA